MDTVQQSCGFIWQRLNIRTFLLASIVFLLAYLVIKQSYKKWNMPPGPRNWWPIIGHLASLDRTSPYRTMASLADEYGPVISLQFGSFPVVVLNDYASTHQAFVKQGNEFDTRPKWMIAELNKNRGMPIQSFFIRSRTKLVNCGPLVSCK